MIYTNGLAWSKLGIKPVILTDAAGDVEIYKKLHQEPQVLQSPKRQKAYANVCTFKRQITMLNKCVNKTSDLSIITPMNYKLFHITVNVFPRSLIPSV